MSVDKQIAIIYLGTTGFLSKIPTKDVPAFERDYLQMLEAKHQDTLAILKKGEINDKVTEVLKEVANDLEARYTK